MKTLNDDQVRRAVMTMIDWHMDARNHHEVNRSLSRILAEPQEESPIPYRPTKAAYSKSEHAHFVFPELELELERNYDEVEEVAIDLSSVFGGDWTEETKQRWRAVARRAIQWKNDAVHDAIERGVYDSLVRDARDCEEMVDPLVDTDAVTIRMCSADRPSVYVDDECTHGCEP